MPLVLNRRAFLQASLAVPLFSQTRERVRWALLSDTHIAVNPDDQYRGFSPTPNLKKAAAQVRDYAPKGTLITGDLARLTGTREDYSAFRALIEPIGSSGPVALGLGNHDERKNFFDAMGAADNGPVRGKHVAVIDAGPVRFVMLDSLLATNGTPGLLGKAQRAWLTEFLNSPDTKPTILFVHHPPDDSDSNLLDSDRLLRIAAPARKVKAIVFGHTHAYSYNSVDGLHLVNIPSTAYNFADSEPVGWVEAEFSPTGAEMKLRALAGNTAQDGKSQSLQWR